MPSSKNYVRDYKREAAKPKSSNRSFSRKTNAKKYGNVGASMKPGQGKK